MAFLLLQWCRRRTQQHVVEAIVGSVDDAGIPVDLHRGGFVARRMEQKEVK